MAQENLHFLTILLFSGFICIALPIAWIDLRSHRIPNRLNAGLLATLILGSILLRLPLLAPTLSALELLGALTALRLLSRGGVGMGDLKLAPSIGWISYLAPLTVTLASAGISALLLGRLCGLRGGRTPFAPFLVFAGVIGFLGWTPGYRP
jgi:leader peptidase (prepilin peptidase)/N-methyltransferase